MCEDVCSCVGKQGADGCWGRERCNHDQMDSVFRETSSVLSTRRFPALKTNLFKKCTYLLTWPKGNIQANRGFPFLKDWTCSPWASRVKVYLGCVRTLQAQLPGPHGALGPCSLSTSGRGSPLSQGRFISLALALFWLVKEEQPLRAEASPFHPGAWFC